MRLGTANVSLASHPKSESVKKIGVWVAIFKIEFDTQK